jgi:glycosyltransferase involved in cell wall biosynthesis
MTNISVAMAVFNGSRYIREQIESILIQLGVDDELVISYDESEDDTYEIISTLSSVDSRIKIFKNPGSGIVKNFENAIRLSKGEYIFLADQDDVWLDNKIKIVIEEFKRTNSDAIAHDYKLVNENLDPLNQKDKSGFELRGKSAGVLNNIIRLSYIGCCLAFKSKMVPHILPIPTEKRSHDWWIGTVTGLIGKFSKLDEKLIYHRIHMNNATPKRRPPLTYQVRVRAIILFHAICRYLGAKVSR